MEGWAKHKHIETIKMFEVLPADEEWIEFFCEFTEETELPTPTGGWASCDAETED